MDAALVVFPAFTRFRGDTKRLRFTLTDDNGGLLKPDDHTLYLTIAAVDGNPLVQKQNTIGGFTTLDNDAGTFELELVPADDAALPDDITYPLVIVGQHNSTGVVARIVASITLEDGVLTNTGITLPTTTTNPGVGFTWENLWGVPDILSALAAEASNGLLVQTSRGVVAARSIAQGANIVVTNGDGIAGNPTVALAASPALTGIPTAPTAGAGANTTQLATTAFVTTAVANLVNSSPSALDTLAELAAALGNDANFATTVTNSIATKLAKASNLSDLADAAAARINLGVQIGVNVQAYSAQLASAAGLSTNGMVARTAANTFTIRTLAQGANIVVTNGDGVAGNPTIALADSPALTGTPTAPTATALTASTQLATTAFVATAIANLINAAPGALDTLKELADALGDDPSFATTITTALATKLVKANNLSDLTNAATARSNIGLGNVENTALSAWAGTANITTLGTITTGTWTATTIAPTRGGTGLATYALGDMLYASAANTLAALAGNTAGTAKVLTQTGTGTVSAAPVWSGVTGTLGSVVLSVSPTITGHPTLEGVTSTGATGTGNLVFSASPTISGTAAFSGDVTIAGSGSSPLTVGGDTTSIIRDIVLRGGSDANKGASYLLYSAGTIIGGWGQYARMVAGGSTSQDLFMQSYLQNMVFNVPTSKTYTWQINNSTQVTMSAASFTVTQTTISSNTSSGAFIVGGGAGFGGAINAGDSSTISKSQNSATSLIVSNLNGSTASRAAIYVGNDASNFTGGIQSFGTSYTTSNQYVAGSMLIESIAAAGMGISGANNGPVKIWNNAGVTATFTSTSIALGTSSIPINAAGFVTAALGFKTHLATDNSGGEIFAIKRADNATNYLTATDTADGLILKWGYTSLSASNNWIRAGGTGGTGGFIEINSGVTGSGGSITWMNGGVTRWAILRDPSTTEAGGNVGSDLVFRATNDAGSSTLGDWFKLGRATGSATFGCATSGTATTAAAVLAKSIGLTENLYVGGFFSTAGNANIGNSTGIIALSAASSVSGGLPAAWNGNFGVGFQYAGSGINNMFIGDGTGGKINFVSRGGSVSTAQAFMTDQGQFTLNNNTEATIAGAASLVSAGGFYSAKKGIFAGGVIAAIAALATNATTGFLYVPSCAGAPTGVPVASTGTVPLVVDSTNNKAYIYAGGAWVALN